MTCSGNSRRMMKLGIVSTFSTPFSNEGTIRIETLNAMLAEIGNIDHTIHSNRYTTRAIQLFNQHTTIYVTCMCTCIAAATATAGPATATATAVTTILTSYSYCH